MATGDAFPPATLEFLAGLRACNTREWFDAHRSRYEADVLAPAKAFVEAIAPRLERLSPGIHAEPRVLGSIFRINRDTRFSADKRPYKDHLDFWFWHGERAAAVSGLFLRLSPDAVAVGAGAHDLDKDRLSRFRAAVCDAQVGRALVAVADALGRDGVELGGRALTRPPKGYEAAPDAARFLLHKSLFAAVVRPAASATEPGFAELLERTWRPLVPLHEWLVAHVQG